MVPKLHAKGRSFRGAAMYLLHDKDRARTSERVSWTQTRNLVTDNPHQAWRIMAATSIDRDRLKRQAGVSNAGRKSDQPVLHLTLSWHPDEKQGLTKDEMMRAALGAVRALKAEDRQALFVCHGDEPQPHVHVLLNRVSPEDGRMLTSSKEKLALSRWAQRYEEERQEIRCPERILNNAARDRGEYVRGEPDKPRHIFELEAANDDRPDADRVRSEQRERDARLAAESRRLRSSHAEARKALSQEHRQTNAEIRKRAAAERKAAVARVRDEYRPRWRSLLREQRIDRRNFEANERRLLGKVQNALRLIDLREVVRAGDRRKAISGVFSAIASAGTRLELLKELHRKACEKLARLQRADERTAVQSVRRDRDATLGKNRKEFSRRRSDLKLTQRMERAALRSKWKTRSQERTRAWTHDRVRESGRPPEPDRKLDAKTAEALQKSMRARQAKRTRKRDLGHDDDRGRDR